MAPAILPRAPLGSSLSVAICGAGIGGLAAAVGLAQRGFSQVTVSAGRCQKREEEELIPSVLCTQIYESAPEIAEVGAGIQVAPNFCRVLDGFGILEELKKQVSRRPKTQYQSQQLMLYLTIGRSPRAQLCSSLCQQQGARSHFVRFPRGALRLPYFRGPPW